MVLRMVRSSLVATLVLVGVTSCGGSDEGSSDDSSSPVSQISAVDGFSVVRPGEPTQVDLSIYVRGAGVTLSSISSDNEAGCSASNQNGLSIDVTNDSGLCIFTYKVAGQGSYASATLTTFASTLASPVLPSLSQTMTLAEPNKTFDLEVLLGADWPAGYNLEPTSILVQGGSSQGTVTSSGNVLTYTPPGEPVWNKIIYVLTNPAKPGEDAFGMLYVTVSDSVNAPPVIGDPKYNYNTNNSNAIVAMETATLDLATLANLDITEPDGGEWQLVEVQSYSASVAPVDPTSVTNKQFTFLAATPGENIVSYIVGDHEGGFTMGLIIITVVPKESPKTWNNIIIGDNIYLATPLYIELLNSSLISEPVYDDVVANTVAGVTYNVGQSYCGNSHVANIDELNLLRTTPSADAERLKYPVERTYISSNIGQLNTYDLLTGTIGTYDPDSSPRQYLICVADSSIYYTPSSSYYGINTAISDSFWHPLGVLTASGGTGDPIVTASTDLGTEPLTEANVQLTPSGCPLGICQVEVKGDTTTYGQFTVEVPSAVNPAKVISIELALLQDARVSNAQVGINNSAADGVSANTVVVTVTNHAGGIVANSKVKLKYNAPADVTILPISCENAVDCSPLTTDDKGHLTLTLTSVSAGDYVISFPQDSLVGGLPNG